MAGKKAAPAASSATSAEGAVRGFSEDEKYQHEKGRQACLHRQLLKTKFCTYFLKGACHYGTDCAFAHTCSELQAMPDLRKTRVCKAFGEVGCTDPDCTFAHGEQELVSTGLFHKMSLCKWNEKGNCRNGNKCRFAHGAAELRDGKANAVITMASSLQSGRARVSGGKAASGDRQKGPANQPEPMKVLQSRAEMGMEPVPGTSAAALAAAAAIGLPLMQAVPPGLNSWLAATDATAAFQTLTVLEAWRLHKVAENPSLADVQKMRMLTALSAQLECSQMKHHLNSQASLGLREQKYSNGYGADMFPTYETPSIAELAMLGEFHPRPKMFQSLNESKGFPWTSEAFGA